MAEKTSSKSANQNMILFVVAALLIGWIIGFIVGDTLADSNDNTNDEVATEMEESHSHSSDESEDEHSHGSMQMVASEGAPTVELSAFKDTMSGYNIKIDTTNFEFTPENVGGDHVDGQGHAHIYVDDMKLGRVYGNWYYLKDAPGGEFEVRVTLNANSHADLAAGGEVIEDTLTIDNDGHDHTHAE